MLAARGLTDDVKLDTDMDGAELRAISGIAICCRLVLAGVNSIGGADLSSGAGLGGGGADLGGGGADLGGATSGAATGRG